jgi:hypothetical protein
MEEKQFELRSYIDPVGLGQVSRHDTMDEVFKEIYERAGKNNGIFSIHHAGEHMAEVVLKPGNAHLFKKALDNPPITS